MRRRLAAGFPLFFVSVIPAVLTILTSAGCTPQSASTVSAVAPASEPTPQPAATSVAAAPSPAPSVVSAAPVSQLPPNEAGLIPVLEYHRITKKPGRYDRTAGEFGRDLERLYKEGYRPVALQEVLRGEIDLPRGASPVVFTFDDADASQFRLKPDGSLDPECAVGVMKVFAAKHPDWKNRASFYVLPESAFGPAKQRAEKLRVLRDELGFEIGNHTITHRSLRAMSDTEVQKEIGGAVQKINALLPNTPVESIALPMGIAPRNRSLLAHGTYAGHRYTNTAVLLVGANPAPSPYNKKFDPLHLPRIQAVEGADGITYWLDKLKKPGLRYVSDGDPQTVTIPKSEEAQIDSSRLNGRALAKR